MSKTHLTVISLILFISLAIAAVLIQNRHLKPAAGIVPQTATESLIKIGQPNALFFSKIFLNRNKTFVSLPYQFPSESQTIWLSLETNQGTRPIKLLISHPTLENLEWDYQTINSLTLFQKQKKYASLEELIKSPPKNSQILADPALVLLPEHSKLQLKALPDDPKLIDLNQVDYILTTYLPHTRRENSVNYFETTLDATNALTNSKDELSWLIYAPFATESNPYYVGNIHVDYRQ